MRGSLLLSTILLALGWSPMARGMDPDTLPFAEFSENFLEQFGLSDFAGPNPPLEVVLEHGFARFPLGAFDLHFPAKDLKERKRADLFQELSLAILDLQMEWMEWSGPDKDFEKNAASDTRKWIAKWNSGSLALAVSNGGGNLAETLSPDEETRAALQSFNKQFRTGAYLGLQNDPGKGIPLVLAPTRTDFLGFASYLGTLSPASRQIFWVDTLPVWTYCRLNRDLYALALEYATPNWKEDFRTGMSMNSREKTGVQQHVLQHCMDLLSWFYFKDFLDPALEAGIGIDMVVEVLGQNNARAGGSGASSATAAISKFVPGGNPSGGTLPRINADSRWRQDKGKDHFKGTLKTGQLEGYKLARGQRLPEPKSYFALSTKETSDQFPVGLPFFGEVQDKKIPDTYLSDYREFFRAYKAGFVHWLRIKSKGKKDSPKRFRELVQACAQAVASGKGDFAEIVEQVYGTPLTGVDSKSKALEWEYVQWIRR